MPDESDVHERMRADWNERAREDAHYYVAFGGRDQDEQGFDATAAEVLSTIENELARLPANANPRTCRALEIGCGPGRLMRPLSRHFGEIHGVDVSDEMIRMARERLAEIPHAHVHATNGASLNRFADESFDFIYSYAVFQHIPSRDVVLEYMREIRRVLKPGGVFRGQFNGLPYSDRPTTWAGVAFSAADIRAFTRENGFQLMELVGENTQYMWTTWRLPERGAKQSDLPPMVIHRITNACSWEPVIPNRGRFAAIAVWVTNLPEACDLNSLEVRIDGTSSFAYYIGPSNPERFRQVNVWLPQEARTGLLPVELFSGGKPLGEPGLVRVIPAGPPIPRIIDITDGINLVEKYRSISGSLKVHIEELMSPDGVSATIEGKSLPVSILRTDPRPPRYEVNVELPKNLAAGPHTLEIRIGARRVLPANIVVGS
jgi:ubiquinone/menaquinone biosynthesis C-methylase UbiE